MHRFLENLKDFRKNGDWVLLILCLIVLAAAMVFVQFFLPELLTMVDNMITTLKGE